MKNNFIHIFYMFLLMSSLTACSKDERLLFEEATSVYFDTKNFSVTDSLNYSFALLTSSVVRDTISVNVRITGKAADYDREVKIITEDGSTAKSGYHFEFINPVIPAGAYDNDLQVIVYRKAGLKDSVVTAFFKIEDSKDLVAGYNDVGVPPVGRTKYGRQHYKLTITDKLVKPANWDNAWLPFFGEYSAVKIRFITAVAGFTNWTGSVFPQDKEFVIQKARYELFQYEQANGALIDENGFPVKFN